MFTRTTKSLFFAPSQAQTVTWQMSHFSKVTRQRSKTVLAFEVKKAKNLTEYFDNLMHRRREGENGVIDLPRRNFEEILQHHVHTEEDYDAIKIAFYNYLGHRNTFPQTSTDALLQKALILHKPELAFELIGYHAELLIQPNAKLMRSFLAVVLASKDYKKLKAFFEVTKGRYFLQRPANLNRIVIEQAIQNQDKETVIDAYLDILDYERELEGVDQSFFSNVLESMTYEEAIDHVLFGHVKEQMDQRGLDCRIHSAIYYLHAKGGLTAADILKDLASDTKITKLVNSELFKTDFIEKVVGQDNPLKLDNFVLEQVQLALKQCKQKIDTNFYGISDFLGVTPQPELEAVPDEGSTEKQQEQQ